MLGIVIAATKQKAHIVVTNKVSILSSIDRNSPMSEIEDLTNKDG